MLLLQFVKFVSWTMNFVLITHQNACQVSFFKGDSHILCLLPAFPYIHAFLCSYSLFFLSRSITFHSWQKYFSNFSIDGIQLFMVLLSFFVFLDCICALQVLSKDDRDRSTAANSDAQIKNTRVQLWQNHKMLKISVHMRYFILLQRVFLDFIYTLSHSIKHSALLKICLAGVMDTNSPFQG